MKSLIIILISLVLFFGVECSTRMGDFTILSSKNVDIGGKYKKLERHSESDIAPYILFFPIGEPNLEKAVDECIENGQGDLLTNAVVESSYWWAILYGEQIISVSGDVWEKATMSDLRNNSTELYELVSDEKGLKLICVEDKTKIVSVDYYQNN